MKNKAMIPLIVLAVVMIGVAIVFFAGRHAPVPGGLAEKIDAMEHVCLSGVDQSHGASVAVSLEAVKSAIKSGASIDEQNRRLLGVIQSLPAGATTQEMDATRSCMMDLYKGVK